MRKTVGAIIGFAILFGLLLAVVFYNWFAPANTKQAESQALAELEHRLTTVDDLQRRGILSKKVAEAQRQHYSVKAQTALSESHFQALVEIKYRMETVNDLHERAIVSEKVAQAEKQRYLVEARTILGETLDSDQLPILLKYLDSGKFIEAQQAAQSNVGTFIPIIIWIPLGLVLTITAGWLIRPYLSSVGERLLVRHQPSSHAAEAESNHKEQPPDTRKPTPTYAAISLESPDTHPPFAESLTRRELEVLTLVAKGLTNREIAEKLIITPGTAKVHISNIYGKLSVKRRVQAISRARELGILPTEQSQSPTRYG